MRLIFNLSLLSLFALVSIPVFAETEHTFQWESYCNWTICSTQSCTTTQEWEVTEITTMAYSSIELFSDLYNMLITDWTFDLFYSANRQEEKHFLQTKNLLAAIAKRNLVYDRWVFKPSEVVCVLYSYQIRLTY